MQNNTLTYRVGQLEKKVDGFDTKIDSLMENHIPHLREDIAQIRSDYEKENASMKASFKAFTCINIGAIIISLIISKTL